MTSILIGGGSVGVLAAVLSLTQNQCVGCVVCLGYIAAGMIAVWHHTNTNQLTISGGEGAGMGAMAGIVAGIVAAVLSLVFRTMGLLPTFDELLEQVQATGQFDQLDAETADMIFGIMEFMFGIGGYIFTVVFALILGVIGGAIGASVFKKGEAAE